MKSIHYGSIVMMLCFMIFLSPSSLHSQEILIGVGSSRQLQKSEAQKVSGYPDTLSLPFIDDFARGVGYPFDNLWEDNYAYVNYQYPVNPPSIGVVTMDALDGEGMLYPNANSAGFEADKLTSKPLDLDLEPSDSVYLSFYYQPGGRGDTSGGEFQDSLILQYYSPDSARWQNMWSTSYSREDTLYLRNYAAGSFEKIYTGPLGHRKFYQAMVPVKKEKHLKKGFRFRFRNYASLSEPDEVPSRAGNIDHWHLDFIRLDKHRTHRDTIINDIAFVKPLESLLINYESVPWRHWPEAKDYEMSNRITITYRNLGNKVWKISREFEIIDRMWDNETETFTGGSGDDIPPFTKETYPRNPDYIFPYNGRDSALFEIKSYLVTDTLSERAPYRWNDTIRYFQKFYNYYAYDDGTAENGYGIPGEGSENARVAMKFRTYSPDTLQAIQIYFNQTLDNASRNSFKLMIWENDNGKPGEVIYEQEGLKPVYEDSVNQFHNYVLKEKPFLEAGHFFIGYQKFNTDMLNVGFDVNNVNNDKMFYNIAGTWNPSGLRGTLMMRPVFGDHMEYIETSAVEEPEPSSPEKTFNMYPNPARNQLNIDLEGNNYSDFTYTVFDIQGRAVIKEKKLKRTVHLEDLPPGMYLLKLRNRQNHSVEVKKFLISR
ncbi:MAG: T9SS type A sorting domain-containing protein [Bacteroidales bacterium]|nr:T9SS type A sorting domain-containing protein [Bacteroidales bacterium]